MASPRATASAGLLLALLHQTTANYYCGTSFTNATTSCSIPCPSAMGFNPLSTTNECTSDMPFCFLGPSDCIPEAEREEPTVDDNPGDHYCSDTWRPVSYDGPCGTPCPRLVSYLLIVSPSAFVVNWCLI
jgi:hypothetical protein